MSIIITRSGKGSALTHNEMDTNWDSLSGIVEQQTGATYTVVAADQGRTIELDNASMVVTLDAIATILAAIDTNNFQVTLRNINTADATVQRSSTDTIESATSITMAQYETITFQTDSTGGIWIYKSVNWKQTGSVLGTPTLTTPVVTTPTITGGTVNGLTTVGTKFLATPVLLVNASATTGSAVLVDMSVVFAEAATAGATAAIINITSIADLGGPITSVATYAKASAASINTSPYRKLITRDTQNVSARASGSVECTVPLDGSSDFYWYASIISGAPTVQTTIYLVGYHV